MNVSRRLQQNRATVILITLTSLSFLSLVTGTEAGIVHNGLKRVLAATTFPFVKVAQYVGDSADYVYDFVAEYDEIRAENAHLNKDLAQMRVALANQSELQQQNRRLRGMLGFVREEPRLTLEPVRVVQSYKGTLIIDRGRVHGIKESMCCIAEKGVVGLIIEVNDFTSTVATLHHPECRIGAMVRRNRLRAFDGVIHGGSNDLSLICTMEYIDQNDQVLVGDRIVTSPESVFPAGYPIGTITRVLDSDSLWKRAYVDPAVDPYTLDEVFVVRRAVMPARQLADAPPPEAPKTPLPLSEAPEQPDDRPLQEIYAP